MSCAILYDSTTIYEFDNCTADVGSLNNASNGNYTQWKLINNHWVKQRVSSLTNNYNNYTQYYAINLEYFQNNAISLDALILPATILGCALFWFLYKMLWGARR